jgi:ABC-type transport system involved in multi-copper enzyme maturation permease subunit
MILWKIWFDLRYRFLICMTILMALVAMHIAIFPYIKEVGADWMSQNAQKQALSKLQTFRDFGNYTDMQWFQNMQRFSLLAIVLSMGGILTERKARSIFVTLTLPVERRQWLLLQAGVVFVILFGMGLLSSILLFTGGIFLHHDYPFGHVIFGSILLTLTAMPWIGITLLVATFTEDQLKTGLLVIGCMILIDGLAYFSSLRPWMPENMTSLMIDNGFPWKALLTIFVVTLGSVWLAVRRFEQTDY